MFSRAISVFGILILLIAVQPASLAQFKWPQSPENLEVLPKNTKIDQLKKIMGSYTEALGVRCSNCHYMSDPKDVSTFDFASDKVPAKEIAREMIRMTNNINKETISKISELSKEKNSVEVNCYTCHRGYEKPMLLEDVLYNTVKDSGTPAGINQYNSFRTRYYGKGTFDFSEESLINLGDKLKPNEAITFLKLNTELFPESPKAFIGLSEGFINADNTADAVSAAEKVMALIDKAGNNNSRENNRLKKQAQNIIDKYKSK